MQAACRTDAASHSKPSGFWSARKQRPCAAAPNSDLHPKSHLDDGVVRNLEEIGGAGWDPVEEEKNRKRKRIHRRAGIAANDRLMRDVIVLVVEIGVEP